MLPERIRVLGTLLLSIDAFFGLSLLDWFDSWRIGDLQEMYIFTSRPWILNERINKIFFFLKTIFLWCTFLPGRVIDLGRISETISFSSNLNKYIFEGLFIWYHHLGKNIGQCNYFFILLFWFSHPFSGSSQFTVNSVKVLGRFIFLPQTYLRKYKTYVFMDESSSISASFTKKW